MLFCPHFCCDLRHVLVGQQYSAPVKRRKQWRLYSPDSNQLSHTQAAHSLGWYQDLPRQPSDSANLRAKRFSKAVISVITRRTALITVGRAVSHCRRRPLQKVASKPRWNTFLQYVPMKYLVLFTFFIYVWNIING